MQDITPYIEWAIKGLIGWFVYRLIKNDDTQGKKISEMDKQLSLLQKDHDLRHESLARSMNELAIAVKENTEEQKQIRQLIYEKLASK
jgi:hypothetical protein